MKKLISLFLVVLIAFCSQPVFAYTSIYYGNLDSNGEVSWELNTISGELVIEGYGDIANRNSSPFEAYSAYIKTVVIEDYITGLGNSLFSGCNNMIEIRLPESIYALPDYIFENCSSLVEITIPMHVSEISPTAFDGCTSLQEITVESENKYFSSEDGILYNFTKTEIIKVPPDIVDDSRLEVNQKVTTISPRAFYQNKTYTEIILERNVSDIEDFSFYSSNISKVHIRNAGCVINGSNAFTDIATIYCYKNSSAHTYALNHSLSYVLCDSDKCSSHAFISRIINPTCTAKGYTEYTCSYCNFKTKDNYVDAMGHAYTDILTKATYSKNGKIETKCRNCNNIKSTKTIYYIKTAKLNTTKYTYNGKAKKPKVTVKDSKGNTIQASNYKCVYSGNTTKVGKHSVKIILSGNYNGNKTLYYTIVPKATSISSVQALSKKKIKLNWKKNTTETTGYQICYSTDKDFTKNKKTKNYNNKTTSATIQVDKAKTTYYFRVRTYKLINNKKYYSAWSKTYKVKSKK